MLKQLIIFLIVLIPTTTFSAQFDIWETGITLSEVVETARLHDIPIRQSGVVAQKKGFNQRLINERFWKSEEVGYVTTLLGQGSKVILKISSDRLRRVYEIEIRFAGKSSSHQFKSELLNMLTEKYGKPNKTSVNLHKTYRWEPVTGDQIQLIFYSFPVLSYADVKFKAYVQERVGYKAQNQKHGYTKKDSSKF